MSVASRAGWFMAAKWPRRVYRRPLPDVASNANLIYQMVGLSYQPVRLFIDRRQKREVNTDTAESRVSSRPPHFGERQWIALHSKQTFGARAIAL
jgi:hypothetical protein